MRRNCIEARLIEKEDVKQEQYREFTNGPTTPFLLLIKYCATKTALKRFIQRGIYIDQKSSAKPFQVVCHVCQRSRLSLKRLGLGVNCQPAQGLHLNMLRHLKRRICNMVEYDVKVPGATCQSALITCFVSSTSWRVGRRPQSLPSICLCKKCQSAQRTQGLIDYFHESKLRR